MSSTWIVAALYFLIVAALGLVVRWEYQRLRNRALSQPAGDHKGSSTRNSLPVD